MLMFVLPVASGMLAAFHEVVPLAWPLLDGVDQMTRAMPDVWEAVPASVIVFCCAVYVAADVGDVIWMTGGCAGAGVSEDAWRAITMLVEALSDAVEAVNVIVFAP